MDDARLKASVVLPSPARGEVIPIISADCDSTLSSMTSFNPKSISAAPPERSSKIRANRSLRGQEKLNCRSNHGAPAFVGNQEHEAPHHFPAARASVWSDQTAPGPAPAPLPENIQRARTLQRRPEHWVRFSSAAALLAT